MPALWSFLLRILTESVTLYWTLVKIMVPVMIVVKIAVELGLVGLLSEGFAPVMGLVGLPNEMGLVWATAVLVNMYGGAAALLGVLPDVELTVAQMTIIASMILAAHAIPLEQRVCQKAGVSFLFSTGLRFLAALLYGLILNALYSGLDLLQQPVNIAWLPTAAPDSGWLGWAQASLMSLASIFLIIVALVLVLRLFDVTGLTDRIGKLLAPLLRFMGIGKAATPLALVGVLLGLSYGAGLIIREAKAGTLPPRDIFLTVCFMAICHSMIEDTLFMMALGGHWSGVMVGRFVFSLLLMAVLARIVHALPDALFERWLYRAPTAAAAPAPT